MMPTPELVRAALAAHRPVEVPALPGRTNHLAAGVLVPLVWDPDPVALLLLRASHLRRHAGEVCFPGGAPDPADADLEQTALREAREELGITRAEVLGRLSSMPLYTSDFRLVPFVAAVPRAELVPDPTEVAAVLRVRVLDVLELPAIAAIPYTLDGREHLSPVFRLESSSAEGLARPPCSPSDSELLYGATAHTFLELLEVLAPLYGRAVPPLVERGLAWSDVMARP